jgi:hypothetical protein
VDEAAAGGVDRDTHAEAKRRNLGANVVAVGQPFPLTD